MNAETICAAANLSGYPTIKYYAPFSLTRDGDTGYNRASHVSCFRGILLLIARLLSLSSSLHFFEPV